MCSVVHTLKVAIVLAVMIFFKDFFKRVFSTSTHAKAYMLLWIVPGSSCAVALGLI